MNTGAHLELSDLPEAFKCLVLHFNPAWIIVRNSPQTASLLEAAEVALYSHEQSTLHLAFARMQMPNKEFIWIIVNEFRQ